MTKSNVQTCGKQNTDTGYFDSFFFLPGTDPIAVVNVQKHV